MSSDALLQLALGIGVGSLATAGSIATADLSAALATSVLLAVATITMIVGLFAAWGARATGAPDRCRRGTAE